MNKIAFSCSYIPSEIIVAAGFSPVRFSNLPLKGNCDASSLQLPTYLCSYAIECLNCLSFSNDVCAVVIANACHAMENIFERFQTLNPNQPSFLLNVPKQNGPDAIEFYIKELTRLKNFLQDIAGKNISDAAIDDAFEMTREKSLLQNTIPPLLANGKRGAIKFYREIADVHNKSELAALSEEIETISKGHDPRNKTNGLLRIGITGSVCSPTNLVSTIEDGGAQVVFCDTCDVERILPILDNVEDKGISRLAKAYLGKPLCARFMTLSDRINRILGAVNEYKIDGLIFSLISFCPDQTFMISEIENILKKSDVPLLILDDIFHNNCSAQIETRIQAFLEILKENSSN